ncbi:uncharacterized protein LOC144143061 [Haemaphysalis longicornis]
MDTTSGTTASPGRGLRKEKKLSSGAEKRPKEEHAAGEVSLFPSPLLLLCLFVISGIGIAISIFIFNLYPRPASSCKSAACKSLMGYMTNIVDNGVEPCHDFYRHVCGRWLPNASRSGQGSPGSSFMADVARDYREKRHQALMGYGASKYLEGVPRYYRSCVTYLGSKRSARESIAKFFEVLGVKPKEWLSSSHTEVFNRLLRLSFMQRFDTLFKVRLSESAGQVSLVIDGASSFKQRISDTGTIIGSKEHLRTVLKAIDETTASDAIIDECIAVDDAIDSKKKQRNVSSAPATVIGSKECPEFSPDLWINNAVSFSDRTLPAGLQVMGRGFDGICADLKLTLLNSSEEARSLYPLALLALHILEMDIELASVPELREKLAEKLCYQHSRDTFKRLWSTALTNVLAISGATIATIDSYLLAPPKMIEDEIRGMKWMSPADMDKGVSMTNGMSIRRFDGANLTKEELHHSRYNQSLDMREKDFVYNRANVMNRTKFPDDVDQDPSPGSLDNEDVEIVSQPATNTFVLPHMYALSPIILEDLADTSYAKIIILGVQLARKILELFIKRERESWWSAETVLKYQGLRECYGKQAAVFHNKLANEQFDEAFAAAHAIRLAYREKVKMDEQGKAEEPAYLASGPLFFRRACLSLCSGGSGLADANSLDMDTASAACTMAVSNMPEFHEAFHCNSDDRMAAPKICSI